MSSPNSPFGGMPLRPCQRCGGPLASNVVRCGNCGYSNPFVPVPANVPMGQPLNAPMGGPGNVPMKQPVNAPMGGPGPGMVPPGQGSPGFGPSSGMYYGGPGQPNAPMGGPGNVPMKQPVNVPMGAPMGGPGPGLVPPGQGSPGFDPSSGMHYGGPGQQLGDGNLYSGVSSPAQGSNLGNPVSGMNKPLVTSGLFMTQEGPNVRRIVILVVILLLVIAGSAGVWKLVPRADGTVSATPMVAPTVVPNTVPLFADQFGRGNINGWNTQSAVGKYNVNIQQSALILENDENKLIWELVPGTRPFSDFKLFVDARLTQGDQNNGYGIYIRGGANQNSPLATYYRFELYGDRTFTIFKGTVDTDGKTTDKRLADYTYNHAIQSGGTPAQGAMATPTDSQAGINHISITAQGANMAFSVNGQTLATITDASYAGGSIALFVSNLPEAKPGAQAMFSLLGIYPADAH
ncbi:MAG: hypothetical protein E6J34_13990 [Chloroflexi bacterium]|nr:MAG: hypothetical protein E6J34_13990 [Chloroflexota bacterium]